MAKRGKFIVIEGTDGSGKATQVKLLRKKLQIMGVPHQLIEFPRYTNNLYGRLIGEYLKGEFGNTKDVNSSLIALAYAGDRALAKPLIESWLKDGNLVIADRYVASNKAYMTAKLPEDKRSDLMEWLDDLEYNVNGIPREELTILLYVSPKQSQKNVSTKKDRAYIAKGVSDIHEKDLAYQTTSSNIYLKIAKEEDWAVVECMKNDEMRTPQDINQEIISILKSRGILKNV